MAGQLKGTLLADFEKFYDACQKADVELKGMETNASKVEGSLNRMADAFSGRKIIQDATLAAEAVERIGGATKLTENEQAQLNAKVTEALAKYQALGQQAPQAMLDLQKATQGAADRLSTVNKGVTDMGGLLGKLAGTFGVAFSAQAVVGFAKDVIDSASKVHDLAEQIGISTDAVQGFSEAAELSGSSIDDVGAAIQKMNKNLAEGDKSTVQALKTAGLNFSEIRSLKPEDAFLAIADAIQGMKDPMEQSQVALTLFGKSSGALLPGIKEGFRAAADAASKMSKDTVDALEQAQDAWDKLSKTVKNRSAEVIAASLDVAKGATSSWQNFAKVTGLALTEGIGAAGGFAGELEAGARAAAKNRDVILTLPGPIKKTKEELDAEAAAQKKLNDLFDKFSGKAATKDLADLEVVLKRLRATGTDTQDNLERLAKAAAQLSEDGGKLPPQLQQLAIDTGVFSDKLKPASINLSQLGVSVQETLPWFVQFHDIVGKLQDELKLGIQGEGPGLKIPLPKVEDVKKAKDSIDELAKSLSQLAQVSGGAFGDVARDLATFVTGLDTAKKSAAAMSAVLKAEKKDLAQFAAGAISAAAALAQVTAEGGRAERALKGAAAGAEAGSAFGPYGTAIGAIAGAIVGLVRGANQGRNAVVNFANSFGGFDTLHTKLETLGAAGEQLWIKLTQGVGANNPDQAAAVINEVNAAFQNLQNDISKYGLSDPLAAANTQAQALYDSFERLTGSGLDTDKVISAMSGDLNDWLRDALNAGQKIPPGMQPILDKLIEMGKLTEENAAKLLGLSTITLDGGSFDDIMAAADRYGITLDELGGKVNQLNIDKLAEQLSGDWKLLTSDGEDVNAVMAKMAPKVQDVVSAALKFGDEIPDSMKPMIDKMIEAGLLTDQFGGKLKDDSSIKFAKPLSEQVETLIDKLNDLIDALIGNKGLGGALETIGNKVVSPKVKPVYDDSGLPEDYRGAGAGVGGGSSAGVTPASVGAVAPIHIENVLNLDGYEVARSMVVHLPGQLKLAGIG